MSGWWPYNDEWNILQPLPTWSLSHSSPRIWFPFPTENIPFPKQSIKMKFPRTKSKSEIKEFIFALGLKKDCILSLIFFVKNVFFQFVNSVVICLQNGSEIRKCSNALAICNKYFCYLENFFSSFDKQFFKSESAWNYQNWNFFNNLILRKKTCFR